MSKKYGKQGEWGETENQGKGGYEQGRNRKLEKRFH